MIPAKYIRNALAYRTRYKGETEEGRGESGGNGKGNMYLVIVSLPLRPPPFLFIGEGIGGGSEGRAKAAKTCPYTKPLHHLNLVTMINSKVYDYSHSVFLFSFIKNVYTFVQFVFAAFQN